jgi:molybdopterin/thiamine biosynthesis adenylyltransferase
MTATEMNIKVIGIGAGGTNLIHFLGQFMNYRPEASVMTLVDGDKFEAKNYRNQRFKQLGNKAENKKLELRDEFDQVRFRSVPEYVTPDNVADIIEEGDIVFLAVDNYKTMSIVNAHCRTLEDIVLISGGVDEQHDKSGDVCIYIRCDGRDITPDLTYKHPEVAEPEDKAPFELNCDQVIESKPARLVTVLAVVDWMMATFLNYLEENIDYYELYFDSSSARVRKIPIPEAYQI